MIFFMTCTTVTENIVRKLASNRSCSKACLTTPGSDDGLTPAKSQKLLQKSGHYQEWITSADPLDIRFKLIHY